MGDGKLVIDGRSILVTRVEGESAGNLSIESWILHWREGVGYKVEQRN